jgi:hypothetical protein
MSLHPWGQFGHLVADISVLPDPDFSFMLIALNHHLKARD